MQRQKSVIKSVRESTTTKRQSNKLIIPNEVTTKCNREPESAAKSVIAFARRSLIAILGNGSLIDQPQCATYILIITWKNKHFQRNLF